MYTVYLVVLMLHVGERGVWVCMWVCVSVGWCCCFLCAGQRTSWGVHLHLPTHLRQVFGLADPWALGDPPVSVSHFPQDCWATPHGFYLGSGIQTQMPQVSVASTFYTDPFPGLTFINIDTLSNVQLWKHKVNILIDGKHMKCFKVYQRI